MARGLRVARAARREALPRPAAASRAPRAEAFLPLPKLPHGDQARAAFPTPRRVSCLLPRAQRRSLQREVSAGKIARCLTKRFARCEHIGGKLRLLRRTQFRARAHFIENPAPFPGGIIR